VDLQYLFFIFLIRGEVMLREVEFRKYDKDGNEFWEKVLGIFSDDMICRLPGCNRRVSGKSKCCCQSHHMKYIRMKQEGKL